MTEKRKVEYGVLAVQDQLPAKPSSGPRSSPLMKVVQTVIDEPQAHGKAVNIAVYESKTACGAAANVLRQRYGRNAASRGLDFATRKHTVRNEESGEVEDRHGLWVVYDPARIVEGEYEKHRAKEEDRITALKARAAERAAANGSEVSAGNGGGKSRKVSAKG